MINDPVLINEWHVVGRAADLAEGQLMPARVLGEDVVVWRLNGQVLAWQDLCIHRGTRLSLGQVEGETLICPYHGWSYNSEGRCVHIPAHPGQTPPEKARVKVYQATERYGAIWVSLGQPQPNLPPFPEWDDPTYRSVVSGPHPYRAHAPRAIENFLDMAHLPFVHAGYLGEPEHAEVNDYEVQVGPDGIVAEDIRMWQPDPDGTGIGATVSYTFRVLRPLMAYFGKEKYAAVLAVTPVDDAYSIGWMFPCVQGRDEAPDADILAFQKLIIDQDVPIVESQRPELLPLDLQAELHLRSDRTAIAYRKWLKELGVTFGVA
ncbi:MAG: aromatic ring-hydroxylating dioxygenase subunit alpha [Anaerolineae bacterium]|nr:aromatic ring-hydroxylating dioxygenase subunit alpha [Anaerolineae bacterium]